MKQSTFFILLYIQACCNMVTKLGLQARDRHWSKDEVRILKTFYPVEGGGVTKRLPGRTLMGIQKHACKLGLTAPHEEGWFWTKEEICILKDFFPIEGRKVCERLPHRSAVACYDKARKLGLKKRVTK